MFKADDVRRIVNDVAEVFKTIVSRRKTIEEVTYADLRPGDSVVPHANHPDEVGVVEAIETPFGRQRHGEFRLFCNVTLRYQDGHAGHVSAALGTKIMRVSK